MTARKPKILLSEGSSLSSRETITALGLAGHRVELMSSDPLCLGRFSRFVGRVHRSPASGADPDGYLAAVMDVVKSRSIDVLLPVHEQAYLFAAARKKLPAGLGIALADFEAFEQVQSKASLAEFLSRLDVPQPATEVIHSADEFARPRPYPFFVKAAFGTASTGVWCVSDERQRDALLQSFEQSNAFAEGLVVQAAISGALERTQAVFDRGRLVACHIYRQIAEGPGGVLTRLGLMGILDAARWRQRRRDILLEIGFVSLGAGRYRGTREELVPLWTDPYCAIPLAVVIARLLRHPQAASRFAASTV